MFAMLRIGFYGLSGCAAARLVQATAPAIFRWIAALAMTSVVIARREAMKQSRNGGV